MTRYEKYKPSSVEWIGEIPAHWKIKRLKYSALIKYGLGQPPKQKDDGLPLIRATNIERGKIVDKGLVFIDPDDVPYDRDPVLKEHDIIVVRSGAYTADSALIPKKYEGAITGYDMVVRAIEENPIFIAYCLLSDYVLVKQLYLNKLRAAQPHLNKEELGDTLLLLPLKDEQPAIAAYLDDKTAQIDKLIANKQKLIDLLKEERTAIINQAVTKGINPNAKLKPSGIEWLGDIPVHWEVKKLKYVLRINSGDGIKSENIHFEGSYPVYGGNGILGYTEDYSSDKSDIIIGRVGAKCGNVRLVEGKKWISDNALRVTTFEGYDLQYVAILLDAMNLNSLANQNAQPLITGTMVKERLTILPPTIEEQIKIVKFVEISEDKIGTTISKIEQEIDLLKEYRTALISEVVTGKVKVF